MTGQEGLFGRGDVGTVRDDLDRHFTPLPLARLMLQRVAERYFPLRWAQPLTSTAWEASVHAAPAVLVEPSVGGGNIVRAALELWPDIHTIGVDLDPMAEGLDLCHERIVGDWREVAPSLPLLGSMGRGPVLVAGNPPFSGKTDAQLQRTLAHVRLACELGDLTCLILPWGPLGGVDQWAPIMHGDDRPADAWPFSPRPWGDHVREAAVYKWPRDPALLGTNVQWLPRWKP